MLYVIQATVTKTFADGSKCTVQVPTFYLSKQVQGIINKVHAEQIAQEVIDPFDNPNLMIEMCVEEVEI